MVHRLVLAHAIVRVSPPDADWLLKRQFAGTMCCTLRRGGTLVGVCFARRVGAGACDAGMFIEPEARGGLAAIRFAEFVEQVMQGRGAAWMLWECEPQSEVLAQRRGLLRFSARYLKLLEASVGERAVSGLGDALTGGMRSLTGIAGDALGSIFNSDPPDTSGMNEQARRSAELADRSFEWFTQEYERTRGQRDASTALSDQVAHAQLDNLNLNSDLSRDLADYQRTTFRPVEQRLASEAMSFDTPERREQAAGQAAADVNAAAGANRTATMRAVMRRGGSVSGARMASMADQNDIGMARASASAQNTARSNIQTQGWARMSDVANLGRNIASNQATSANVATQAGSGAVQAAQAGTRDQRQRRIHDGGGLQFRAAGHPAGRQPVWRHRQCAERCAGPAGPEHGWHRADRGHGGDVLLMKALHFSGGIDSLALLWLMRAQWPELHVFWLKLRRGVPADRRVHVAHSPPGAALP